MNEKNANLYSSLKRNPLGMIKKLYFETTIMRGVDIERSRNAPAMPFITLQ
jgi:hypothetical protein